MLSFHMNFTLSSENGLKLDLVLVSFSVIVSVPGLVRQDQAVQFGLKVWSRERRILGLGLGGRFWGDLGWWDWMPNLDQCVTTMLIRNEPLYKFIFEPFSLPLRSERSVPPHFKSLEITINLRFPDPTSDRALWTGQLDSWIRNVKTWRLKNRLWNFFLNWNDLTQNKMTHSLPRPNWFQVTSKKGCHQTFSQWHKRQ